MTSFVLDARLAADTIFLADWRLSRVLLMNDARYPWLVLVPMREGVTEIFHLERKDRALLIDEAGRAGRIVAAMSGIAKVNVGALGNLVPQLHMHVVGRRPGDPAWPGPVWGHSPREPYGPGGHAPMAGLVSGC